MRSNEEAIKVKPRCFIIISEEVRNSLIVPPLIWWGIKGTKSRHRRSWRRWERERKKERKREKKIKCHHFILPQKKSPPSAFFLIHVMMKWQSVCVSTSTTDQPTTFPLLALAVWPSNRDFLKSFFFNQMFDGFSLEEIKIRSPSLKCVQRRRHSIFAKNVPFHR